MNKILTIFLPLIIGINCNDQSLSIKDQIAEIVIVSISLLIVLVEFIVYLKSFGSKKTIDFAVYRSQVQMSGSQNKFNNFAETEKETCTSKMSEPQDFYQDQNEKSKKKRKRKADRLSHRRRNQQQSHQQQLQNKKNIQQKQ